MATLEALSLSVSADVKDLLKGLADGKKNIKDFVNTGEASLQTLGDAYKLLEQKQKSSTNPADIKKYTSALQEVGSASKGITALATQDLPKLGLATKATGKNIGDLGGALQGVQTEAGSAGETFKGLATALLTGGGIGLATTLLTALVVELFRTSDAALAAAASYKDYVEALSAGVGKAKEEIAQVETLISVVNNHSLSLEARNKALNDLKEQYPKNLALQQTDINDGTKLAAVTNTIADALLRKARASAFADLIAKEEVKIFKLQNQTIEEGVDKLGFYSKASSLLAASFKGMGNAAGGVIYATDVLNKGIEKQSTEIKVASDLILKYKQKLNDTTAEQYKLNDADTIGSKSDGVGKKLATLKTYKDVITEFRKDVAGLQAQLAQGLISKDAVDEGVVKALTSTIGKLGEIKAPLRVQAALKLEFQENIQNNFRKEALENIRKSVEKDDKPEPIKLKVKFNPEFTLDANQSVFDRASVNDYNVRINDAIKSIGGNVGLFTAPLKAKFGADFSLSDLLRQADANPSIYVEQMKAAFGVIKTTIETETNALKAIVATVAVDAFVGIGNSIADGLQGKNFGASLFSGLFQTLGAGLQAYGKKIIETSTLLQALQSALSASSFGTSIVLGIGLVALGGLTKNLGGSLKLASGGYVNGAGTKTSDSIPAQLSKGEYVIKAAAVDKFGVGFLNSVNNMSMPTLPSSNVGAGSANLQGNGMAVNIDGQFVIAGDSLRLLLDRANKTYSRNT